MKRAAPGAQNSPIDLPLDLAPNTPGQPRVEHSQPELPLGQPGYAEPDAPLERREPEPTAAPFGRRLAGGALDLAVHLSAFAAAVAGSWWLGVPPGHLSLFPLLLLIACFSFVYHVLPLTFWGHTPGMASVGLVARSIDGGPLTIGQAIRRWLGAMLTVASFGLLFLLRRKRSLADRFSGSSVRA